MTTDLTDVATAITALRQHNPMNGSGVNWQLDNVLRVLDRLAGDATPSAAAKAEWARLTEEYNRDYCKRHGMDYPEPTAAEKETK